MVGFRDGAARAIATARRICTRTCWRCCRSTATRAGAALKLAQRDDALARGHRPDGVDLRSAGDQERASEHRALGAIARRYQPDFYGPSTSPLQGGLPTDRLVCGVVAAVGRGCAHSGRKLLGRRSGGEDGGPPDLHEFDGARVEVPARAVYDWKRDPDQRKLAESLQTSNRLALESAFARGLAITGYERSPEGDGCFLLGTGERIGSTVKRPGETQKQYGASA
jgi:predicted GNAT superfamily acetyltransferase